MKELSIEQKAKAYNKALEKAKEWHSDAQIGIGFKANLEKLFPELAESWDERIVKCLLNYFHHVRYNGLDLKGTNVDEVIDWLKKQNKENMIEALRMEYEKGKADALLELRREWTSKDLLNMNEICEILDEYCRDDLVAWLEKQGEQTSTNNQFTPEQAGVLDKHINKNLEQKPSDIIETKFHVGEWITNGAANPMQISSIKDGIYFTHDDTLGGDIESMDKEYHLWTIDDAKDGDVLATDDWVFIFKKFNANGPTCYCHYDVELGFVIDVNTYISTGSYIRPAAKEQRDTLMKAINKAGYTFDFKKKELKKVEPKSNFELSLKHIMEEAIECGDTHNLGADAELLYNIARKSAEWSEEDYNKISSIKYLLHELDNHNFDDWLDSLKCKPQYNNSSWSEEDEKMLNQIISIIKDADDDLIRTENISIYTNWLKSKMQPQLKWKPSELQIEALESATENCAYSEYQDCLKELIIELKKLTE